jgi:hypothetical protein
VVLALALLVPNAPIPFVLQFIVAFAPVPEYEIPTTRVAVVHVPDPVSALEVETLHPILTAKFDAAVPPLVATVAIVVQPEGSAGIVVVPVATAKMTFRLPVAVALNVQLVVDAVQLPSRAIAA